MKRCLLPLLLVLVLPAPVRATEGRDLGVAVARRTAAHVYLNAGRVGGLEEGQEYGVYRDGVRVGVVRVVYVAEHSATAEVTVESGAIQARDVIGPVDAPVVPAPSGRFESIDLVRVDRPGTGIGAVVGPSPAAGAVASDTVPATRPEASPAPARAASTSTARPSAAAAQPAQERRFAPRPTDVGGTVRLGWDRFGASAQDAASTSTLTGRVDMRVNDIGGSAWNADMRMRLRQVDHGADKLGWYGTSESRHRLYQLSLAYAPPEGRFGARIGRIGVSPFVGIGYLDGILAEARVAGGLRIGGFGGAVPQINGINVDFAHHKYGGFARLQLQPSADNDVQILAAGIRESFASGNNRDYAALEVDWSAGSRFTLLNRVEIDLSRPQIEGVSTSSLANFSVLGSFRLATRSRLSVSYVRSNWLPYDFEAFDIPWIGQPVSTDRVQAMFSFPGPSGIGMNLRGGMRKRADQGQATLFGGFGVNKGWRGGFWLGASATASDDDLYRTLGASASVGKNWRSGLRASVAWRMLAHDSKATSTNRTTHWGILSLAYDIGRRAFIEGEGEISTGDLLDGQRFYVGLGYRF